MVEAELRKGTSKSRIAHLVGVSYEEGSQMIAKIKDALRPNVGESIHFTFRNHKMIGQIDKLLTNSAVVIIDWNQSDHAMKGICADKTIVNFKDIISVLSIEE